MRPWYGKEAYTPPPSDCQAVPSQRTIRFNWLPPTHPNSPAAIRSPPNSASASTGPRLMPKGCHWAPSHRAIPGAGCPPANSNPPETTNEPLCTIIAPTEGGQGELLPRPAPTGCQAIPSHRARPAMGCPAARSKRPPAMSSPPNSTTAITAGSKGFPGLLLMPLPRLDHAAPSQRAMQLDATPPICWKVPPAINAPSCTPSVRTPLNALALVPPSRSCHWVPSHAPMLPSGVRPPSVNWPPATSRSACGPGPSGSQFTSANGGASRPSSPSPGSHCPVHWPRAPATIASAFTTHTVAAAWIRMASSPRWFVTDTRAQSSSGSRCNRSHPARRCRRSRRRPDPAQTPSGSRCSR